MSNETPAAHPSPTPSAASCKEVDPVEIEFAGFNHRIYEAEKWIAEQRKRERRTRR